tara:strand:+ start:13406 stop:13690 length:285 start_codon:yes stop_codon:yes gene_type:complete
VGTRVLQTASGGFFSPNFAKKEYFDKFIHQLADAFLCIYRYKSKKQNKTKQTYIADFDFPNRTIKEHMVDALVQCGDEGRGVAAKSFGEVPSNL